MVKIIWTEQSLNDLDNIAEYISKNSYKYAKITLNKIFSKVEILKTNPKIGRIVPELQDEQFRELINGNYRIIYKIIDFSIEILTIHHSSRDLSRRKVFPF